MINLTATKTNEENFLKNNSRDYTHGQFIVLQFVVVLNPSFPSFLAKTIQSFSRHSQVTRQTNLGHQSNRVLTYIKPPECTCVYSRCRLDLG